MILKFHNFFDRIFRLFSSFLQQKKVPHLGVASGRKKVPSCFFSNEISRYLGLSGHSHPQNQQSQKKYKKKENHLLNFQSSLRSFLFRTSRDGFAHDSTIRHSCGSVKALPSRSNTWMLFMDRYRLMLYGLCAGKKWYKRYVRCICMCIKQNCLDILEDTTLQPAVRVLIV